LSHGCIELGAMWVVRAPVWLTAMASQRTGICVNPIAAS